MKTPSQLTQVVGAALEQESILRIKSATSDKVMVDEPTDPEIRLSAKEAKLAAMGAAKAEKKFYEKSPEQLRAVKERYGSQSSYQRAVKIMIDSGMIDEDMEI